MSPGHLLSGRGKKLNKKEKAGGGGEPLAKECEKKQDLVGAGWLAEKIPEAAGPEQRSLSLRQVLGSRSVVFEKLKKKKSRILPEGKTARL